MAPAQIRAIQIPVARIRAALAQALAQVALRRGRTAPTASSQSARKVLSRVVELGALVAPQVSAALGRAVVSVGGGLGLLSLRGIGYEHTRMDGRRS